MSTLNTITKRYDQLKFTDDFMFCKVLSCDMDLSRRLLERILDVRIKEVRLVEQQKPIELTADGRGIRLDLYVDDGLDTVYDIEMQTSIGKHLPKRSRYYQGMMDLNLLERGARFRELRNSYIIFICLEDPFKYGLPVYTFKTFCCEDPGIVLADGTCKVFINAEGDLSKVSPELSAFLTFLKTGAACDAFTEEIESAVIQARLHKEWRQEYMTLELKFQEIMDDAMEKGIEKGIEKGMAKGIEKGIEKGMEKGREDMILEMLKKGRTPYEISEFSGVSLQEIMKVESAYQVRA